MAPRREADEQIPSQPIEVAVALEGACPDQQHQVVAEEEVVQSQMPPALVGMDCYRNCVQAQSEEVRTMPQSRREEVRTSPLAQITRDATA